MADDEGSLPARIGIAGNCRSSMDDRRRFGQRRGPGKRAFGARFRAGRLERQDIRRAEVADDQVAVRSGPLTVATFREVEVELFDADEALRSGPTAAPRSPTS